MEAFSSVHGFAVRDTTSYSSPLRPSLPKPAPTTETTEIDSITVLKEILNRLKDNQLSCANEMTEEARIVLIYTLESDIENHEMISNQRTPDKQKFSICVGLKFLLFNRFKINYYDFRNKAAEEVQNNKEFLKERQKISFASDQLLDITMFARFMARGAFHIIERIAEP